jgi:hypothetical protein
MHEIPEIFNQFLGVIVSIVIGIIGYYLRSLVSIIGKMKEEQHKIFIDIAGIGKDIARIQESQNTLVRDVNGAQHDIILQNVRLVILEGKFENLEKTVNILNGKT